MRKNGPFYDHDEFIINHREGGSRVLSHEEAWQEILETVARESSHTVMRTWFDDMEILRFTDDLLVLYTPPGFKRDVVQRRFLETIINKLKEIYDRPYTIQIVVEEELEDYKRDQEEPAAPIDYEPGAFTFDNFVVGSSNKFAHAAAQAVADAPGQTYNPLFMYGGSGLGKTHLLYAILERVKKANPAAVCQVVTGEQFTRELVIAIRNGKNYEFHEKYRQLDLLLVDDIQFIAGRDFSQEEFFHTFNALYESQHQIVLTSDRPPKDMEKLEERLRTRFEWGIITDLKPPDFETRMAIINVKAYRLGLSLSDEVIDYIAHSATANVRQIEGVVKKLVAYRDLMGVDIDMDAARRSIADVIRERPGLSPTPILVLQEVCSYYNVEKSDIFSANRRADLVLARQTAMYLTRLLTNESLHEIGRFFRRDHTTVAHGCDRIEAQKATDVKLARDLQVMTENIKNK